MLWCQTRFPVTHLSSHLIIFGVSSHFSGQLAGSWLTTLKPRLWLDNTLTCATLIVVMISEQGCLISFIKPVSVEINIWTATSISGFLKSHQIRWANVCVGSFLMGTLKKKPIAVVYFWKIYNTTHSELHLDLHAVLIIRVETYKLEPNTAHSSPLRGEFMPSIWIPLLMGWFPVILIK